MRVLLVNIAYGSGSTGKIIADIERCLHKEGHDTIVAYRTGDAQSKTNLVKLAPDWVFKIQSLCSKLTGWVYDCSPFSTKALFRLIERECPDVVNLHCINGNLLNYSETIEYLKQKHICTVLSIHAEFPYTGGCGHSIDCEQWMSSEGCGNPRCPQFHKKNSQLPISYFFDGTKREWRRLSKAYDGFENLLVTCVSPWLTERAKCSPFFKGNEIRTVMNGLNANVFRPRNPKRLINEHGLENKKVVLHVTPNFYMSIKGGEYVLDVAKRLEHSHPECVVIICGYNGDGSDLTSNVIPVSHTNNQEELAEYYSLAHLTLLTSQRETFSMVCAESLCCGTPVIGFFAGGPESISLSKYSEFVPYGDMGALFDAVEKGLNSPKSEQISAEAQQIYSSEAMTRGYLKVYEDIIN